MGRPRKKYFKIHNFDNFKVRTEVYKNKVFLFEIRFDYKKDKKEFIPLVSLTDEIVKAFNEEYHKLTQSDRNIVDIDIPVVMSRPTGRCSLSCYFLLFDDCEEYVLGHSRNLLEKLEKLFKNEELTIIFPQKL